MADAAPPSPKTRGPLRWILLGCGLAAGLVLLGTGGCAGIFYIAYRGTDGVAEVGAEYLRHSELQTTRGLRIERRWVGWNVRVVNDKGTASIPYTVREGSGSPVGDAVVWLHRRDGRWSAVGARIKRGGQEDLTIGSPPKDHRGIDWD